MSAAAEWADISPFPRCAADEGRAVPPGSVTNLSWSQQQQTMTAAPLFGGRRGWLDYSSETTGFGSVELGGPLAHRVTIVHPADDRVLRRHHRLVRSGRLSPAPYRRALDETRLHVVDRAELVRTRADDVDSWLVTAQRVAGLCAGDDEVARVVGPALRQLLWAGRHHLGSEHVAATIAELRTAAQDLATERTRYRAAVDRWVSDRVHEDIEVIRLETRVLAEVRWDWEGPGSSDT
jgi:hypothetical protein